jgi:hypothetical protein
MALSSAIFDVTVAPSDKSAGGTSRTLQGLEIDPGWQVAERELIEIEKLKDDWDGMGAKAPHPKTAEGAFLFLDWLRSGGDIQPSDSITASPQGHIVFVWTIRDTYIEVEILDPIRGYFFLEFPDGEILSWDFQLPVISDESVDVRLGNTLLESSYFFSRAARVELTGLPESEAWGQK